MMQFLKSILFGDRTTFQKINKLHEDVFLLTTRVTLIEEELKRSIETTKSLSSCMQSFTGIITDLTADMNSVALWMQSQAIKELKEINMRKHKKDPLGFDGFSDDDETLIN